MMIFTGVEFANDILTNKIDDNKVEVVNILQFTSTRKDVFWPPVKSRD